MSEENNNNQSESEKDFKEEAKEFIDDAKEEAKEFVEDAKDTLSDGKNVAIIAHLTIIGWVIALIMNGGDKKTELASFYIRQVLGLGLLGIILNFIPLIGQILSIIVLVLWILSLIGSFGGEKKLTPLIGQYFQDWFKSL